MTTRLQRMFPLRIAILLALVASMIVKLVAEHRELLHDSSIIPAAGAVTGANLAGADIDARFAVWNESLRSTLATSNHRRAGSVGSLVLPQKSNASFINAERQLQKAGTIESLRRAGALAVYLDRPVPADLIRKAPTEHDAHFWLALEPGVSLSSSTAAKMESLSGSWNLGWYRALLLAAAFRHAHASGATYWRSLAVQSSSQVAIKLLLTGLGVMGVLVASLVVTILGMVFWKQLVKLPSPFKDAPALPCIEAAIVWLFLLMFGGVVIGPIISHLARPFRLSAVVAADLLTGITGILILRGWLYINGAIVAVPSRRPWRILVKDAGWGVLGYLAILPWMFAAAYLSSKTIERLPHTATPVNPAVTMVNHATSPYSLILLFLMICVLAPIFEERFFRGAIYPALRRKLPVWAAAAITGAIFAGIHPQVPVGFLPLFVIGSGFCLLYELRGSTAASVAAHALNNGLIFCIMLLMGRM